MRLAFLSDIHLGRSMQDLRAYSFALEILKDIQPAEIVLAGDIHDHEAIGKYRKKPIAITNFQEELDNGFQQLSRLVDAVPCARKTYYRGNHEKRLDSYLMDIAKPLHGLKALSPASLYRLDELDIEYIPESRPFKRGHLWLGHGDEFATGTANPAQRALADLNSNILFGHVHRVSTASVQQLNKKILVAWSNSCLCRLDPGYVLNPGWSQGFSLVDFSASGYFSVTPVVFWYDRHAKKLATIVEGVEYGGCR